MSLPPPLAAFAYHISFPSLPRTFGVSAGLARLLCPTQHSSGDLWCAAVVRCQQDCAPCKPSSSQFLLMNAFVPYRLASRHSLCNGEARWVQMAAFPLIAFGLFGKNHNICSIRERDHPRQHGCATSCVAAVAEAGRAPGATKAVCVLQGKLGGQALWSYVPLAEYTPTPSMFMQPRWSADLSPLARWWCDSWTYPRDSDDPFREAWRVGTSVNLPSVLLIDLNSSSADMRRTIFSCFVVPNENLLTSGTYIIYLAGILNALPL